MTRFVRRQAGTLLVAGTGLFLAAQSFGTAASLQLVPQRIVSDETGFTTDVSRDGRLVLTVTQAFGQGTSENPSRLVVRDLTTQTTTALVVGLSPFGRPAAVFSAD